MGELPEEQMDLDQRQRRRLDEFASEFNRRVDTMEVVDALGPLLPPSARQKIQCELDRKGQICANRELSGRVRSRDGWFEKLIKALIKCGGVEDLVQKLIFDKKGRSLMPETDSLRPFGAPRSFPNKEHALEEQATKLAKCNTSGHSRREGPARNYRQTRTPRDTDSHPDQMTSQKKGEDHTQPASCGLTQRLFPNEAHALEEQAMQEMKYATPVQTRPERSKGFTTGISNPEKGTLECMTSQKNRKKENIQIDGRDKPYWSKEQLCNDQRDSEIVDTKNHKVCKESITSSLDEKDKDESADDVILGSLGRGNEPHHENKKKHLGVVSGVKVMNLTANSISPGQSNDATSTTNAKSCHAKCDERDENTINHIEGVTKMRDSLQGACQSDQEPDDQGGPGEGIHERSTICVSQERHHPRVIEMDKEKNEEEGQCQVDRQIQGAEEVIGSVLKTDDDTKLRFFYKDAMKEEMSFSEEDERAKAILKDLQLVNSTGDKNVEKIKQLLGKCEKGDGGNFYEPLRSKDSLSSHNPPSSEEFALQVSDTFDSKDLCTYPPKSQNGSKIECALAAIPNEEPMVVVGSDGENSKTCTNGGFTAQNQDMCSKRTEPIQDFHSVGRGNICVGNRTIGNEQLMSITCRDERIANDKNVIPKISAEMEEDSVDELGCQNSTDGILSKTNKHKGNGGGKGKVLMNDESEMAPILKEHSNTEAGSLPDNLKHNEMKEMGFDGVCEGRVGKQDVENVNDKDDVTNDVRICNGCYKNGGMTAPTELLPEESETEQSFGILGRNGSDVNNSSINWGSAQVSNGLIGRTVTVIGNLAAVMFGQDHVQT